MFLKGKNHKIENKTVRNIKEKKNKEDERGWAF